jgi:hypothetical protein
MAGLGINAGLGRATTNAIFADAGQSVAGDTVGGAAAALTPRFDSLTDFQMRDSIIPDAARQSASSAATTAATPAVAPSSGFNLGEFARDYGGAIAGGLGGALLGDNTQERILYGLGGAALGDMLSGGSLLNDVIGGAIDWASSLDIGSLFGF